MWILVSGLRGQGAKILIMEEASHMDKNVFFKIILPIWMLKNCSILGISTAEDEFNFYSQLMDQKNDGGQPMFKTLRIVVACKDCIAADKGKECKHMDSFQPNWKSQRKLRMLRLIYATQQELFARENLGLLDSGKVFLFREYVPRFKQSPPLSFFISPDVLWMVIDPSGGGSKSQYGLITGTFVGDKTVVRNHKHQASCMHLYTNSCTSVKQTSSGDAHSSPASVSPRIIRSNRLQHCDRNSAT